VSAITATVPDDDAILREEGGWRVEAKFNGFIADHETATKQAAKPASEEVSDAVTRVKGDGHARQSPHRSQPGCRVFASLRTCRRSPIIVVLPSVLRSMILSPAAVRCGVSLVGDDQKSTV
jgi:hypothetical protein